MSGWQIFLSENGQVDEIVLTILSLLTMIHTSVVTKMVRWLTCKQNDVDNCTVVLAYLGKGNFVLTEDIPDKQTGMRFSKRCAKKRNEKTTHSYSTRLGSGSSWKKTYKDSESDSCQSANEVDSKSRRAKHRAVPAKKCESKCQKEARKKLHGMFLGKDAFDVVERTRARASESSVSKDSSSKKYDLKGGVLQVKSFKLKQPSSKRVVAWKFCCGFCTEMFRQQKLLNSHWVLNHSKLMCRRSITCHATFPNVVNRRVHKKAFHMSDGKWSCTHCDKRLVFCSELAKHRIAQKFKCTYKSCDAKFKQKAELTDHLKGHQGVQIHCQFPSCSYSSYL